jgi:hypothetical protein
MHQRLEEPSGSAQVPLYFLPPPGLFQVGMHRQPSSVGSRTCGSKAKPRAGPLVSLGAALGGLPEQAGRRVQSRLPSCSPAPPSQLCSQLRTSSQ